MYKIILTVFYGHETNYIEWLEPTFNEASDFSKQLIEPLEKKYNDYLLSIVKVGD